MRIERRDLDDALRQFVQGGDGLVLGRPGVGKTHSLRALAELLEADGTLYLFVAVDELGDANEEDLKRALGYPGDSFAGQLKTLYGAAPRGVVIFDGFDAARSAATRTRLLSVIRRALRLAPSGWTVAVSVRNYDAAKSPALIALFTSEAPQPQSPYRAPGVSARHFAIPELSDFEVADAVDQIPGLREIYPTASDGFRRLAHVPFNLWLMERVLRTNSEPARVGTLESETQLLQSYWDSQILQAPDAIARTVLLGAATNAMVESRLLSVPMAFTYRVEDDETWQALLSAEVLSTNGPARSRVAFTHNILFDYAVSVLAISDVPGELTAFLLADTTRPLFLRPSLVYYFTRLWYSDRPAFWDAFWHLAQSPETAVRLVGRLIPPYVIGTECRAGVDLSPLVERLAHAPALGADAVLRVLQALRFTEPRSYDPWIAFAQRAADAADHRFAWELAGFVDRVLSGDDQAEAVADRRALGATARALFTWAWRHRADDRGAWYDAFASIQALPLVLNTFGSDPAEGEHIVREVLSLLNEPDFPIRYVNALADGVDYMAPFAPHLVAELYIAIFSHEERSDALTRMGGIILPMTSTRRQDFSMCHYALAQAFPKYLRAAPEYAIGVALDVMNRVALREHVLPYLREGATVADLTKTFHWLGAERSFISDFSVTWGAHLRDEPGEMLDALVEYLGSPATTIAPTHALTIAADHAATAVTWASLLDVGTKAPARFARPLFGLALAPPVQREADTLQPLGTFIENAYEYWTPEERIQFEESLLALANVAEPEDSTSEAERYAARTRDRLLARVPQELLTTQAAKSRVSTLLARDGLPSNEPLVRFTTTSAPYTEDDWLAEQGVDVGAPQNVAFRGLATQLESFAHSWTNKQPDSAAVEDVLPILERTFDILGGTSAVEDRTAAGNSVEPQAPPGTQANRDTAPEVREVDARVIERLRAKLAAAAFAIARSRPSPASRAFAVSRAVLLASARQPQGDVEPLADEQFTSAYWSPDARTEAIQGLATLASVTSDDRSIVEAYSVFADSPKPSERFLAMTYAYLVARHWPDVFWSMMESRVGAERNTVVTTAMLHTLGNATPPDDDRAPQLVRSLVDRLLSTEVAGEQPRDLDRAIADWVIYLAVYRDDAWAWELIERLAAVPEQHKELLHQIVFYAVNVITPANGEDPRRREAVVRARDWLVSLIRAFGRAVTRVDVGSVEASAATASYQERIAAIFRLVDEVVLRAFVNGQRGDRAGGRAGANDLPTSAARANYYALIEPLLRAVLSFSGPEGANHMVARTAHYFMQLLNETLGFDPAGVLQMAAEVAAAAVGGGYQFDSLAVKEVVRLVEVVLTDHRELLLQEQPLAAALRLLDVFADAGWPEALRLVWRLDEAFR